MAVPAVRAPGGESSSLIKIEEPNNLPVSPAVQQSVSVRRSLSQRNAATPQSINARYRLTRDQRQCLWRTKSPVQRINTDASG